ncbi:hypothetical protein [Candidatus Methylocalor cossyra]|uniref:DUF4878 domain-containing protein n=1 Tax=Candidatus Methylocalor cossyra TaxID=3108543 RepID=A0ABP1C4C4_9GAMM
MPKQPGPWMLVAAFGGFFLVLFVVFQVTDLEFFRGDPERGGSALPVRTPSTDQAHRECTRWVVEHLRLEAGRVHSLPDYTAWDLGFDRYLVKAELAGEDGVPARTYLCRVRLQGEAWAVESVEYLR